MLLWPIPFRPTPSGPVLKLKKNGLEVYYKAGLKCVIFRPILNIIFTQNKYISR